MKRLLIAVRADPEAWAERFRAELPDHEVLTAPAKDGDPTAYVVVGKPPAGLLASLSGLELVLSLNAGVEHLLASGETPDGVPIVRMVDPGLVQGMTEWVVAQVMAWHRNLIAYRDKQGEGVWAPAPERLARERLVTVLGAGELGGPVALALHALGFRVRTWGRTPRDVRGIEHHAGRHALAAALQGADVLVGLLPATAETKDLIDAQALGRLASGALVVNAGRGATLVDAALLDGLDEGRLSCAVLDVFREEPLPAGHPFWRHPGVLVSPHVAAPTHARSAVAVMAETVRRHERGEPLLNGVDPLRGY